MLIFDMDDTLYESDAMRQVILKKWHKFVISKLKVKLGISQVQAAALLEEEKQKITDEFQIVYLRKPTYTEMIERIAVDYRVSIKDWAKFKDTQINPKEYLSENPQLINTLEFLAGKYMLVLVSNNTDHQAKQILHALGIKDYRKYFRIFKTNARKPSTSVFEYVSRRLSVLAEQCVSIGDSYEKDIKPALSLGMRGIHVSSHKEFMQITTTAAQKKQVFCGLIF